MSKRCLQCQSVMEKHGPVESIGYGQNYICPDPACDEVEFHNVENDPNTIAEIQVAVDKAYLLVKEKIGRRRGSTYFEAGVDGSYIDFDFILELAAKGELPGPMNDPNELDKRHEFLNRTMKEKE